MMPGWLPLPLPPRDERPPDALRLHDDFDLEDVDREELRGDLAADDSAVLDAVVFDVDERPGFDVRELPLLPFPLAAVFDRADVVLRDEDDLELPLFEPPLLLRDEVP